MGSIENIGFFGSLYRRFYANFTSSKTTDTNASVLHVSSNNESGKNVLNIDEMVTDSNSKITKNAQYDNFFEKCSPINKKVSKYQSLRNLLFQRNQILALQFKQKAKEKKKLLIQKEKEEGER